MGTFYNVTVAAKGSELPSAELLKQWADAEFERINQSMSTYRADSELSVINADATQTRFQISPDLAYVLGVSQNVSDISSGAFDITVAPLVNLWGFGPKEHDYVVPDEQVIQQALASIGYKKLNLDSVNSQLERPLGVTIDLSAVAKGYGSDALANILKAKGFKNFLVEVGGELALHGVSPRGDAWTIGVETPNYDVLNTKQHSAQIVALSNRGMATSGDYRNYYELNGKRFSHTIDPRTGRPITHKLASVTVVAATCAEADALATALNVLGPKEGYKTAEQQQLAAFFIISEEDGFKVRHTEAFKQYMK